MNYYDGLEEILLSREWCDHPPGEVVRVDPVRAAWMRENGYEAAPQEAEEASSAPGWKALLSKLTSEDPNV